MNSDQAIVGRNLKIEKVFNQTDEAKMPAIVVQHIGEELYASIEVNSSGDIILKADDVDGATTTILTIDVSDASYNTFGEVRDAIDQLVNFRCHLIGCRPSQTSTDMLATLSTTQIGPGTSYEDNGITVYFDSATTSQVYGFAITNKKFTACPRTEAGDYDVHDKYETVDENCVNGINFLSLNINLSADDGTTYFYAVRESDDEEILLYNEAFTDATAKTHGEPGGTYIEAPLGCSLIVQFVADTNTSDFSGIDIHCIGWTKSVIGGEVPRDNYDGCV